MRVRCDACRGHKRIMGMGMMEIECEKCDGSGKIDDSELAPVEPKTSLENSIPMPDVAIPKSDEASVPFAPTQVKKAARDAREGR